MPSNESGSSMTSVASAERVAAGVEPHHARRSRLTGRVAVLVPRRAAEGGVVQRPVERADGGEPAVEDHRGRDQPHGAEVDVGALDRELGEGETLSGGATPTRPAPAIVVTGLPGHLRVGERPVERDVERVEEARRRAPCR